VNIVGFMETKVTTLYELTMGGLFTRLTLGIRRGYHLSQYQHPPKGFAGLWYFPTYRVEH
jgi:hypothetical protein